MTAPYLHDSHLPSDTEDERSDLDILDEDGSDGRQWDDITEQRAVKLQSGRSFCNSMSLLLSASI